MALAVKDQIPIREIELTTVSKPNDKHLPKYSSRDQLWAWNRRFKAQLKDLEAQIAVIKRDVARIDRAYYRSKTKIDETSAIETAQDQNLFNPALFG